MVGWTYPFIFLIPLEDKFKSVFLVLKNHFKAGELVWQYSVWKTKQQ